MNFTIVLLPLSLILLTPHTQTLASTHDSISKCLDNPIGKALQCLGSLYSTQAISDQKLVNSLQAILKKLPHDTTYHSIGIVTGAHTHLMASSQNHYSPEWSASYNVNPLAIGKRHVMFARPLLRPVLLYPIGDFPQTTVYTSTNLALMPSGGLTEKVLMQHPSWTATSEFPSENEVNCQSFEKWADRHKLTGLKGIAIVMPVGLWCPKSAIVNFDIVVGSYIFDDNEILPAWEKSNRHTFNPEKIEVEDIAFPDF